ncbi:hypothetical protein BaRGS_00004658, partial [Batillaria attramentaria]
SDARDNPRRCQANMEDRRSSAVVGAVSQRKRVVVPQAPPVTLTPTSACVPLEPMATDYWSVSLKKDIRTRASHCLFDVLATNTLVSWGRYFEDSVHITLSVGRLSSSTGRFYASHAGTKQYRLTRDAYFMHNGRYWQRKPWGQSSNVLFEGLRILVNFDHNENFTIYSVPNCGVRIKFRPYVPDQRPQTLLPGISIQAPRSVQFRDRLSSFPASLCGDLDDSTDLNQVAETMGLRGPVQLYIWALLLSGPAQI